ncbi:hypothetical protein [Streptomyces sp. NPDC086023]|uniref:hypothetical protein n=1 Tax=Streptomyces sp. NPDC086023 TaxID=3365746 RepID=UPI0037D6180E
MDSSEPNNLWLTATQVADALVQIHDQTTELRDDRQGRFEAWNICVATGEGAVHALLALALHTAARESGADSAETAQAAIVDAQLLAVAARIDDGAKHELLAGVPTAAMDDRGHHFVNLVTLLIRSGDDRSELALERISRTTQNILLTLHERNQQGGTVRHALENS